VNKRYIVGAVVVAVAVVAVLVGVSLTGGDGDEGGSAGIQGVEAVQEQLAGVPQSGNVLGNPDAPVEIVEYGDLACPACKLAAETTIPETIDRFVRDGQAKLVFRPIAFISPSSERGALGAEAAGMQDAMWSFVEVLYRNQGAETADWLTDAMMEDAAAQLGLDVDRWREDYGGDEVASRYFQRRTEASEASVNVTPTFVVSGPRGERTLTGAVEVSALEEAIAEVGPRA
jgi:protein-disulfide isomerase